nr:retrovirus-related Pol polyprotein from transposon TNT 1-94 [Tanacetum cinerariifolium]
MASDHVSSDPVPQCQRTTLEHDSLSPGPQIQENVPIAAGIVTTSNELDLLFSPMFDELLNGSTQVVSKSSTATTADASNQYGRQDNISLRSSVGTSYINQPDGSVDPHHPDKVYHLKKALYGLKQAPRERYDELFNFLVYNGFSKGDDKLVSWSSKKQDYTSMSSEEVGYVSLSVCYAQVLWLRTQLTDYDFHFDKISMYCDSEAAKAILCNLVQHSCTKHIDVRYHFIKEQVENGIVELFFVGTKYQLADLFTKALPEDRFKYLVR